MKLTLTLLGRDSMEFGSMFSWGAAGADPKAYELVGQEDA